MADFTLQPGARPPDNIFGQPVPDPPELLSWGWIEGVTENFLLAAGGARVIISPKLFSFRVAAPNWVKKVAENVIIPFTLSAEEPGVLKLAFDTGFYKFGKNAEQFWDGQGKLIARWLQNSDDFTNWKQLQDFMNGNKWAFPDGVPFTVIVSYPPMWVNDP